jgi:hypothetical protein
VLHPFLLFIICFFVVGLVGVALWFVRTKGFACPEGSLDTFAQRAKGRQHFGVYAKGKKTFCSNEQKRVAPKKANYKGIVFF